MNEPLDRARAEYYRVHYRVSSVEQTRQIRPVPTPPEIDAPGQRYFARTMARVSADAQRVRPLRIESPSRQLAYLQSEFGDARPKGIGISQGEYATIASADVNETNRFIATDGIIDCQGLILVARDANGQVVQTLLAHIDAKTALNQTIPELMRHMPEGARVEASIISSPNGYNYYLQSDLIEALHRHPQISSIRHAFDGAHTIAVDTKTGHILTATGPYESMNLQNKIDQWPIDIQFKAFTNEVGLELNRVSERYFRLQRQTPAFGLHQAYDASRGFISEDILSSFVIERQHNDGVLDANELRDIARHIGATINTEVKLAYSVDDAGLATFEIQMADGRKLEKFIIHQIAPELGSNGIIEAANTPPVPGRAPATNTMSPPTGRAPTGRQ